MPGLLRYAEYLFLDPRLGSSENAQKQHTFISERYSFPWIAAKIDWNDHSFLLGFSCLSSQSYIESHRTATYIATCYHIDDIHCFQLHVKTSVVNNLIDWHENHINYIAIWTRR